LQLQGIDKVQTGAQKIRRAPGSEGWKCDQPAVRVAGFAGRWSQLSFQVQRRILEFPLSRVQR
jgi:hypothetical protein